MQIHDEAVENELELIPHKPEKTFLWWHHILLAMLGFLGMNLFALIFREIPYFANLNNDTPAELFASTIFNLIVYLLTFAELAIILLLTRAFVPLFKRFAAVRPYVTGLFYGFIIIMVSVSYSSLVTIIFGPSESNLNQESIEAMIKVNPYLNFFWIVLLGPIVEELIYRVGLFNGLRKVNRILAYVVSGLIFGLIHFHIPYTEAGTVDSAKLLIEFINIPGYIISGVLFGYIYEKEGFATSAVAHVTNNLLSFIVTIIQVYNG